MGWLGNIFGNDKIVDGAMNGIDKAFFTKEEKADYMLSFLKAYEPFKIAQRLLALMFSGIFLFVFIIAVSIYVLGIFTSDINIARVYLDAAMELAKWNIETLGTAVGIILTFYFGGGMLEGAIKAGKKQ